MKFHDLLSSARIATSTHGRSREFETVEEESLDIFVNATKASSMRNVIVSVVSEATVELFNFKFIRIIKVNLFLCRKTSLVGLTRTDFVAGCCTLLASLNNVNMRHNEYVW